MAKGSWGNGGAPAQGGTAQSISRPVEGVGQFSAAFSKGTNITSSTGGGKGCSCPVCSGC